VHYHRSVSTGTIPVTATKFSVGEARSSSSAVQLGSAPTGGPVAHPLLPYGPKKITRSQALPIDLALFRERVLLRLPHAPALFRLCKRKKPSLVDWSPASPSRTSRSSPTACPSRFPVLQHASGLSLRSAPSRICISAPASPSWKWNRNLPPAPHSRRETSLP
jgi:hypothetical protein